MISTAIRELQATLPEGVSLVAVSKYHPADAIREAYAAGQRTFGESHAQELQAKAASLADLDGTEWHFIGHLQRNKVRQVIPHAALIHSVDSLRLLYEIDRQATRAGRTVPCLLQLHVAAEQTKYGFTPDEAEALLRGTAWQAMQGITLAGIMAMATNTSDETRIAADFHAARTTFNRLRELIFQAHTEAAPPYSAASVRHPFNQLSMGMSHDYRLAIAQGSTLVRIGTAIFG